MRRQSRPCHQFHLLFDRDAFRTLDDPDPESKRQLWNQLHWESFLDRIHAAFELPPILNRKDQWGGGTLVWYECDGRRFKVGLDVNQDPHTLFVEPQSYERQGGAIYRPYKVARDASRGFNRLIRTCPDVKFQRRFPDGINRPITRYTSRPLVSPNNALLEKVTSSL